VDEDEENNATVDRVSKRHGTAYVIDDQSEDPTRGATE
jgi:hypothetical protein